MRPSSPVPPRCMDRIVDDPQVLAVPPPGHDGLAIDTICMPFMIRKTLQPWSSRRHLGRLLNAASNCSGLMPLSSSLKSGC